MEQTAATQPREQGAARDPAVAVAHQAMASLLTHRLSPTPDNYEVWFGYHGDRHPLLRAALEERIARGDALTQADMDEMHARFCADAPDAAMVHRASRHLTCSLGEVSGLLDTARADATRYGTHLESFSLTLADPGPTLAGELQRLTADTQQLLASNRTLSQRLAERAREADTLRGALEEARRAALTDPLTGLPNRRAFSEAMATASTAGPLGLIVFDLDHFKAVNDRHGHAMGDQVLKGLADILRGWARPQEVVARIGGEEFAVLLPGTLLAEAETRAEALRRTVAATCFGTGSPIRITLSLGVVQRHADEGGEALLARADGLAYDAKRAGRDRVMGERGALPRPATAKAWV